MFRFKKAIVIASSLAALAVPSLALAHDTDQGDFRRDDYAIERLRAEIARDRMELRHALREHRWQDARRERFEIERRVERLRELYRARYYDRDGWR